jgi:hypothetical protein
MCMNTNEGKIGSEEILWLGRAVQRCVCVCVCVNVHVIESLQVLDMYGQGGYHWGSDIVAKGGCIQEARQGKCD